MRHAGSKLLTPALCSQNFLSFCDLQYSTIIMSDIELITSKLIQFRDERDWAQFHNPKDLALAINVEAGELLELFLWKEASNADSERVKEELADILAFALLMAHRYGFDVRQIILDKIESNGRKYPVEKSKGSARKYNEL
jgi:NTP pyrophosphatase (non-canonical NTP hydrolase)